MFTALAFNFGDIRNKISSFVALAPVLNLGHSSNSFIMEISKHRDTILNQMNK
jgi:hypothetical protein